MDSVKRSYDNLETLIDCVHELFDHWETNGAFGVHAEAETVQLLKLAVHEWLANLVQHADFGARAPEVSVHISPNGEHIKCSIQDNSEGFDLDTHLRVREALLEPCPERGMGLLMLDASTEELSYNRTDDGRYRLDFAVPVNKNPWLDIPF